MRKKIYRMELKNIQIPTNHGCTILTYDVYVNSDFDILSKMHDKARDSLKERVIRDIKKSQIKLRK